MQVRLLGPVDVVVDGEPRPVRGLRRKAILAALALNHGTVVSSDRLTNLVWGENAPPTAPNTLQAHVSHLRGVLSSRAAIVARQPGYVLDLGDDGTDARVAERLLQHGARSADPARQRPSALERRLAGCRAVVCPGSFVGRQGSNPEPMG